MHSARRFPAETPTTLFELEGEKERTSVDPLAMKTRRRKRATGSELTWQGTAFEFSWSTQPVEDRSRFYFVNNDQFPLAAADSAACSLQLTSRPWWGQTAPTMLGVDQASVEKQERQVSPDARILCRLSV